MKHKGFSSINLNWDAVRSFVQDVGAQDKLSKREITEIFDSKSNSEEEEKTLSKHVDNVFSVKKDKEDRTDLLDVDSSRMYEEQLDAFGQENKKEKLIDIVETLHSCAKARKDLSIYPIARVHCLTDGKYETYWFVNQYVNLYGLPEIRKYGSFVPRYSDIAVNLQKMKVGGSFKHVSEDKIKRMHTYSVTLDNRSDLQNQTIEIAGDSLIYQYRNIQDFLQELQNNKDEISDTESQICELKLQYDELKDDKRASQQKAQITRTIKVLEEKYRILTQQQEDLKNITIYIRKQDEMRYSYIVDPTQTRIMSQNLFDGNTIVIDGGPGTGKTTTLIHRLSYLTDRYAIKENESNGLNNYKLNHQQRKQLLNAIDDNRDWLFFSPSQMLREYLANAMKKEGLNNTRDKVWDWRTYCQKILQENYHLLEMPGSNAPFKVCYQKDPLFYQDSDIINVFTNFYLNELRSIKLQLPKLGSEGKVYAWKSIAQGIQKRFDESEKYDLAHFISLFNSLESVYGDDCKTILRDRNDAISELADEICVLLDANIQVKNEIEDIFEFTDEEQYVVPDEEYNENEENDVSNNIASKIRDFIKPLFKSKPKNDRLYSGIQKWLKAFCYSRVNADKELSDEHYLINDVILPILGDKYDDIIQKIGNLMVFEQFAQYTRGVRAIMLNGLPTRYKRFRIYLNKTKHVGCDLKLLRDIIQSKQGKELHYQEQSLLLGFVNTLVKQIKATTTKKIQHDYIEAYEYVARPIIGIDEATDFSICDIYAMQSLLTRDFNSLTLCGDMMQRMTSYGIKSWKELDGVVNNPKIEEMKTSYRQSTKLLEVARQLSIDTLGGIPKYKAFMKSSKVPAPLIFIEESEYTKIRWISKRISEVYRAYGEQLPSIAIFVNDKGYIPRFIEGLQDAEFFTTNKIKVLDGTSENKVKDNHISVYPIDKVKGMEFDVVFFHNIDNSYNDPDIVKRYIYVGISRAAFFLGITMSEKKDEISRYFVQNKDWFNI